MRFPKHNNNNIAQNHNYIEVLLLFFTPKQSILNIIRFYFPVL